MKKKLSFLTAAFVLLYSSSAFAASFADMPSEDSKYYSAMEYAINNKIVNGDGNMLNPSSKVTRAEAAAMLCRALSLTEQADLSSVTDVSESDWYYSSFARAVKAGLLSPFDGKLLPESALDYESACALLKRAFPTASPASLGEKPASVTRADFILWLCDCMNSPTEPSSDASDTANASEQVTESATQAPSESAEVASYRKQAEEIRIVALGILSDGTYYTKTPVYRDEFSSSGSGGGSGSSSSGSRPSSGGSSSGGSSGGSSDEDEPTNAPTSPTEAPTAAPTEAPTDAPTEPPTYTGEISNDKDNVVDDPFDDDWTGGGSGTGDSEDEDFNFDDDDIFGPTQKPSEEAEPTDIPSSDEEESEPSSDGGEATSPETGEEDKPEEETSSGDGEGDGSEGENEGSELVTANLPSLFTMMKERWFV